MKRIGIVTLLGYYNYGNRLQNYALKRTLEKLGFETISLKFKDSTFLENITEEKTINEKNFLKILPMVPRKLKQIYFNLKFKKRNNVRTALFKDFTEKFLNEKEYESLNFNLDYYIVGSDQVWNPNYIKNKPYFFLNFTDSRKKIAYAASFGLSELDQSIKNIYEPLLRDFTAISVRENEGSELVREMIGYKPEVVLDPTMLLDSTEWDKILKTAHNRNNEKYLLTYFLGGIDEKKQAIIDYYIKNYDLKIINLGDINERVTYETSPAEFLDYIKNCQLFLTDSFHGIVFSIIYEKLFIAFRRGKMNSRIDTLLEKFNLENRKIENIFELEQAFEKINYENVHEKLSDERKKSLDFLKGALNLNGENE